KPFCSLKSSMRFNNAFGYLIFNTCDIIISPLYIDLIHAIFTLYTRFIRKCNYSKNKHKKRSVRLTRIRLKGVVKHQIDKYSIHYPTYKIQVYTDVWRYLHLKMEVICHGETSDYYYCI